ncbi:MAG: LPS assembly protein LptD [Alphaproteobacteria bacterium]
MRLSVCFFFLAGAVFFTAFPSSAQMLTSLGDESPSGETPPSVQVADSARLMTGPEPYVQGPYEGDLSEMPVGETAAAQSIEDKPVSNAPVDLQADTMEHDEAAQTVTASGDVMLVQSGRIFRADQIIYYLKEDRVIASGDVVLNEESGDIHYSEQVELHNEFKDGFVKGLKTYLADGSRFTAADGTREGGIKTLMNDATYTPCEPCKADPEKPPVWQLRAAEVEHDNEAHMISYKHARFEAWGTPIAYVPYFSHPDGTIKRKSGFLAPSGGFKSNLGAFVQENYYWNIAPDRDATIGLMAMTEEAPLLLTQYRQRWNNASLELNGGITHSSRTEKVGNRDVDLDAEVRGHVLGEARWDMNEKWRSGVNVNWASDDQYMRQYDFTNEDVLENEVYAERFSGRDYAVGRLLTFQDIRVRENQEEQPEVMPEIITSFMGEPGSMPVVGGRWDAGASFLGLVRGGSGQDMNRLSIDGGWQRRLVSDYGFLTTVDANARGDFYSVTDRDVAVVGSNRSGDSFAAQLFPQVQAQTSYPMASQHKHYQLTLEPIVALTLAPNIDVNTKIPNEDSQDVQIDASNIFEPNRFPGMDRVEDRSRLTYGVRSGIYSYNGSYADVFLGQSYRLSEKDNPFPEGSGLTGQSSDYVGQISSVLGHNYTINYRFQLNSDDLSSERHEVDLGARLGRFSLSTRYLYASALENTDIDESREQLHNAVGYYLTPEWRVRAGATNDFGETSGLRKAYGGLDFFGQCWSWSLLGVRNFTDDSSGESDTEVIFSLGLKNLGGFLEPDYTAEDFARRESDYP